MNRNAPNNPSDFDPADEALAGAPETVEAFEAAADPRLEALLHEALSPRAVPGGLPVGLADRIVAASLPELQARRGVLARIGPGLRSQVRVLALAACVVVAVSAGLWIQQGGSGTGTGSDSPHADPRAKTAVRPAAAPTAASIKHDLEPIVRPQSTDVDYEIAMLSARVDQAMPRVFDRGTLVADQIAIDMGSISDDEEEAQIF